MQQGSCEEIQLLISRYVDDEVTPEESALVERHLAECQACSCVLLQYVEMAAIFAEAPVRQPEPELRASLFREIGQIAEDALRREEKAHPVPPAPTRLFGAGLAQKGAGSRFGRGLAQAASPLMVAAVPIFLLVGALILGSRWLQGSSDDRPQIQAVVPPLPTSEGPIGGGQGGFPPPVETRVGLASPPASASTTTFMSATATLGPNDLLKLSQPTPVLEEGDAVGKSGWHTLRDPQYGYRLNYPANWWSYALYNTRYFYPWGIGGTTYVPYWIELRVDPNDQGLTAETANEAMCEGTCQAWSGVWLYRSALEGGNYVKEGFLFDKNHIYRLRLSVPVEAMEAIGGFQERVAQAETVFGVMSGRLTLAGDLAAGESAYGAVLFLGGDGTDRGSDLYMTLRNGTGSRRLTWDGGVKSYALSPDLGRVAFAITPRNRAFDSWAKYIYVADLAGSAAAAPTLVVAGMDTVHDLAWYSDHVLVFLGEDTTGTLGLYRVRVPGSSTPSDLASREEPELLRSLGPDLAGARQLAISPDRQLITFLAPLGDSENTDIYSLRPDGSDLRVIVSHASPSAPMKDGKPVLDPASQAVKTYSWVEGRLEPGGYAAALLYTCGNSYSPSFVLGGSLYSGPRKSSSPLVDPFSLVNYEPEKLQITHLAYSAWGKVAFTGYYNDFAGRPDKLEGLWAADYSRGLLSEPSRLPIPGDYSGITDLQWSPDGLSLVYRETAAGRQTARYGGEPAYKIVRLDLGTRQRSVLYSSGP